MDISTNYQSIHLVSTLLIGFLMYKIFKISKKLYWLYKITKIAPLVEGIPYNKILGHGQLFIDLEKFLNLVRNASSKGAPPRILRLGHIIYFVISRPEDLEVVLNSHNCLAKHEVYELTASSEVKGLFNLPTLPWRKHRKVIAPTFNQNILNGFVDIFSKQSEICALQLKKADRQLIDVYNYLSKYSLDSICENAMGYQLQSQTQDSKFASVVEDGLRLSMLRSCNFLYHYDFIFKLSKHSKLFYQSLADYNDCINMMIKKKKEEYVNKLNNAETNCNNKRQAFLDILIDLTFGDVKNWTDADILGEVGNFITAGSDTAATISSFAIVLLAMHPDVQEKCFQEVSSVLGKNNPVKCEDLPKFVYLEKVIKETMRVFTPGPAIMRTVEKDLNVGGYTLPKGAGILIGIIGVHSSEKYYEDPYKFDPERFSPEEIAKRHRYAYIPFSKGPRNCIGRAYGMMSLKTILSVLIRDFRFETTYTDIKKIRCKQALVIKPVEGFPVKAIARN